MKILLTTLILLIQIISCYGYENHNLSIASFNIQIFGQSKMNKPDVMINIAKIINQYDIVAIQEVRSEEQNVIPFLLILLDSNWNYVISERIGRTASKEQYAFLYRSDKITIDSTWQIKDTFDLLHREPFICFAHYNGFDFALINIHTDPDEVPQEINALDDIFKEVLLKEKDAILLGDLNASPSQFDELLLIPNICYAINDGIFTNVRRNKTYDNIIFISENLKECISGGVFDFQTEFNLSKKQALKISDHFPVYINILTSGIDDD